MALLKTIIQSLDHFAAGIGRLAAWLSVLMVLVTCYIVVTRYAFNQGSIAIQESVIYLNSMLFMLTAAFTLQQNGHVRVDIFYGRGSPVLRAWVDLLGSIFLLLPVCLFIVWASWDYVMASWNIREQSGEAGGLPWVYLLKSLILVMGATLIMQGAAEILRNFSVLFLEHKAPPAPGSQDDSAL
ncbi:MAG: TRAP transporter small permease subunit [Pseudohongiellaceae bacterium]